VDAHADGSAPAHEMREWIEGRVLERLGPRFERARVVRIAAAPHLDDEVADVPADAVRKEVVDPARRRDPVAHDPQRLLK